MIGISWRGCGLRRWLAAAFSLACCCATFAWDVEHDELAHENKNTKGTKR